MLAEEEVIMKEISKKEVVEYIEALQKQIDDKSFCVETTICYHRWDNKTGICEKCGHINFRVL